MIEQTTTTAFTLPPGCVGGNLDQRVCRIEDEFQEFHGNVTATLSDQQGQNENVTASLDDLRDQNKNLTAAIEDMLVKLGDHQYQINELSNRPCACQ